MGVLGIVVALGLLMYFAYRGVSVLVLAPLTALLAVVLSGEVPLLASYTQVFMPAAGQFIVSYFPLFLLGAVFGKLMEASGSAQAIASALALTILAVIALNWQRLRNLRRVLDDGANASVLPIFNTASLVGFGAVVAALPAFGLIRDSVLGLGGDWPLVSLALAVGVLAGITGSASGGMTIALQNLGPAYMEMAETAGISPELMHRVTTVATGGLDTLPHNGAVVTLLGISGLTHRQAYGDLFVVAVLAPVAALAVLILLGGALGSF